MKVPASQSLFESAFFKMSFKRDLRFNIIEREVVQNKESVFLFSYEVLQHCPILKMFMGHYFIHCSSMK